MNIETDMKLDGNKSILLYTDSKLRKFFNAVLYVITLGIFYILQQWKKNLQILKYKRCYSILDAT